MKISNYFLLALLALFLGGLFMIANYAHANTKIKVETVENPGLPFTNVKLPNFSVVVAQEGASFSLSHGGSGGDDRINFETSLINTVYAPIYEVSNDTLFVKKNPNVATSASKGLVVIQCQELKSFIGKPNSDVIISSQFPKNTQTYTLDHSRLSLGGGPIQESKLKITSLVDIKIVAKKSEIKFNYGQTLINLNLDLNRSYFLVESREDENLFNEITGSIKNNSRVDFIHENFIRKIDIQGDETSSFYRK